MMTPEEVQAIVLAVLAGQSPGYLASPHASCFVAAGLDDPAQVEWALLALAENGKAMEHEDVIEAVVEVKSDEPVDPNAPPAPEPQVVNTGWAITDDGAATAAQAAIEL